MTPVSRHTVVPGVVFSEATGVVVLGVSVDAVVAVVDGVFGVVMVWVTVFVVMIADVDVSASEKRGPHCL